MGSLRAAAAQRREVGGVCVCVRGDFNGMAVGERRNQPACWLVLDSMLWVQAVGRAGSAGAGSAIT